MFDFFPLFRPVLHQIDPERAHTLTVKILSKGLKTTFCARRTYTRLKTQVFGLDFNNPVGLAAGFDKDAEAIKGALSLGFGFVEAGTVTPKAQPGNPKPRLFRLSADRAVINRFGFNNKGVAAFADKLTRYSGYSGHGKNNHSKKGIIGANVGANKDTEDKASDYCTCIEALYGLSDYFTINVSSPNTPGLRSLQSKAALEDLVSRALAVRTAKMADGAAYVPVLLKIAPDLTAEDVADIAAVTLKLDLDGLIVSNTTIARPESLMSKDKGEAGGLSGAPLMDSATEMLAKIYVATEGKKPIVGVGGIASGADAYRKIRAGASLIQVYSALVYEGPGLVERIKQDLDACLKADGFNHVSDAVGADHRA